MGGEVVIAVLGAFIVWAVVGTAIAFAIKLFGKRESLPIWPILWSATLGTILTMVLDRVLNSN